MFIVSASDGQKPHFWENFDIWGTPTDPLLPMTAKFVVRERTHNLHLHAKFHLNVFIVASLIPSSSLFGPFDLTISLDTHSVVDRLAPMVLSLAFAAQRHE